jgi:hypothetical protein
MSSSSGLCSTCCYAPGCINQASEKTAVLQCEEFSLSPPPPHVFAKRKSKMTVASARGGAESEGLCCNCGNRESCGMRLVEGGGWHCEEYR